MPAPRPKRPAMASSAALSTGQVSSRVSCAVYPMSADSFAASYLASCSWEALQSVGMFAGSIFSAFPVSANNSAASCLASCSCKVQHPPLSPLLLFVELVPTTRCSICFTSGRTPTDVLLHVAYRVLHRRRGLQPGNHHVAAGIPVCCGGKVRH